MTSRESRLLTAATAMTFMSYIAQFMRNPIISLYAEDKGVSVAETGLVFSAFMIAASALAIPLGLVSDRLGRRHLILLGLVLTTASSFLFPLVKNLGLLLAVNALAGLGSAAYSPSMTAFVGDISTGRSVGRNLGIYTTAMQVAMSLGPAIGGAIGDFTSYETTFMASGVMASIGVIIAVLAIPKSESADSHLHGWSLNVDSTISSCWIATIAMSCLWGLSSSYLPLFGQDLGFSALEIGLMFGCQSISNALGRVPLGHLNERFGEPHILLVAGLGLGTLVTATVTLQNSLVVIMALMAGFGLAIGTVTLISTMTVSKNLPRESRGIGMGVYYTLFYGGMALSPAAIGQVIASTSYQTGFGVTSIAGAAGITVLAFAWMRSRRRSVARGHPERRMSVS
jgi:MFS family permease